MIDLLLEKQLKEFTYVVVDVESDSLRPTKLWVAVCQEVDWLGNPIGSDKVFYRPDLRDDLSCYLRQYSFVIGHNFLSFDHSRALSRLAKGYYRNPLTIIDTLVLSRWCNFKRKGGHSLDSWGEHFGIKKPTIIEYDNEKLIKEYTHRCREDVKINVKVFKYLARFLADRSYLPSIICEHKMEIINNRMKDDGFFFNVQRAKELLDEVSTGLEVFSDQITKAFPPKYVLDREVHPVSTKAGTVNRKDFRWEDPERMDLYWPDAPFSLISLKEFNPGSAKQRIEVLEKAKWKPFERTDGYNKAKRNGSLTDELKRYGWKCNEDNLNTLPLDAPLGAKLLAQWMVLEGKRRELVQWITACGPDSRIHGTVYPIGTWTHRMAHQAPNTGNIASAYKPLDKNNPTPVEEIKVRYNGVFRSLWGVPEGQLQVGTDAEGIQLRILAHLVAKVDPDYAKAIEEGRKEDETDIHNVNRRKLGDVCKSRDDAKTFIYAWILGASAAKVANILSCSVSEAKDAMDTFYETTPGLKYIKEELVPRDVRQGYFLGFDGRPVICDSAHHMLAGYLQNGEAVIMKHATIEWMMNLKRDRIWFQLLNIVHDEWQTATENNMDTANHVGKTQSKAITTIGERFNLNCKFEGNYSIGRNWLETH